MRTCCVPYCYKKLNFHRIPFTDPSRWKVWLNVCPFLSKYSRRQLENVRICRIHFKQEHITNNSRLSSDAVPSLFLPSYETPVKVSPQLSNVKYLEITPLLDNEHLNVQVVNPGLGQIDQVTCETSSRTSVVSSADSAITPEREPSQHHPISCNKPDVATTSSALTNAESIVEKARCNEFDNAITALETLPNPELFVLKGNLQNESSITETDNIVDDAIDDEGNLQNENSTTETDSIDVAIDDEGTDPPELEDSIDRPFTWQKQAITCADGENTNVVGDDTELIHESKGLQNEQSMLVDLEKVLECEEEEQEHGGYRCNECTGDIVGFRYACVQCADYDVCAACEALGAHAHHYALRVPSLKPQDEVQRVIEAIQKCINDETSLIFSPEDDSVKIEVKNEDEEQTIETECESDPLMVPTVQSLRNEETTRQVPVLEQDPLRSSNVEHADRTARGHLSKNIQDNHLNQQFIFNASSVPDTSQDYNEVYYMSSDELKSLYNRIEVNDRICLVDDINNPTNSVEESDGQSSLVLLSSTTHTQEEESNIKLKLTNATSYLTKDISDLMCIKSRNLLVKLDRLDMSKLGLFTERRLKNIKNRSTIKR